MSSEPVVHVIDDDEAVRDSLEFMLDAAGLDVRTWESAREFVAAIGTIEPGCIVTDVRMPGMTGLDVAAAAAQASPLTQIVFVTAYDQYAVQAFAEGVLDYLVKNNQIGGGMTNQRFQATFVNSHTGGARSLYIPTVVITTEHPATLG